MEFLISGLIVGGLIALGVIAFIVMILLRRVVPANEVHIVQSSKDQTSFGTGTQAGNTYYAWPSWVPKLGVVVVKLPVSVFSCDLQNYEAYDKGRLPFMLDIKAFFRIENSNLAAQRVANFVELSNQLQAILQGAVRTILASEDIETILSGRAEFGEKFTQEVNEQLKSWGVTTVKTIELMDIRDSKDSRVIANIMEKKKSEIERESRIAVAENKRAAEEAEIVAKRSVDIKRQEALQQVGIRTAEAERDVGIAKERSQQSIQEEAAVTAEKAAAVQRVEVVKAAEIKRDKTLVEADEKAQSTAKIAEGDLKATKLAADGVRAQGEAKAAAEKAMQLAPVEAQIVLAKEIGENAGYQTYLVTLEQVKAAQAVGTAQAEALKAANIKVIANGGTVTSGVSSIGDLFTSAGGTQLGAMLEGLANTEQGGKLMSLIPGAPPSKEANVGSNEAAASEKTEKSTVVRRPQGSRLTS